MKSSRGDYYRAVLKVTFDYDFCLNLDNQYVIARSPEGDVAISPVEREIASRSLS
jgi:hypothetical protein